MSGHNFAGGLVLVSGAFLGNRRVFWVGQRAACSGVKASLKCFELAVGRFGSDFNAVWERHWVGFEGTYAVVGILCRL